MVHVASADATPFALAATMRLYGGCDRQTMPHRGDASSAKRAATTHCLSKSNFNTTPYNLSIQVLILYELEWDAGHCSRIPPGNPDGCGQRLAKSFRFLSLT